MMETIEIWSQSWKNQLTDFMKSRNMQEVMGEYRHFWLFWMDRRFPAVGILKKIPCLKRIGQI
jgi:hypothetical protein